MKDLVIQMNLNEKNEIDNKILKESVANAALSSFRQGEEYNNWDNTTVEFGYLFTVSGRGVEALFKVVTDKATFYFAAQKNSVFPLNMDEATFKAHTDIFLDSHS